MPPSSFIIKLSFASPTPRLAMSPTTISSMNLTASFPCQRICPMCDTSKRDAELAALVCKCSFRTPAPSYYVMISRWNSISNMIRIDDTLKLGCMLNSDFRLIVCGFHLYYLHWQRIASKGDHLAPQFLMEVVESSLCKLFSTRELACKT